MRLRKCDIRKRCKDRRGVGIVAVLLIVSVLSLMGMVITLFVASGAVSKTNDLVRTQAFYLANAGFEYALMRQSQGVSPDGTYNLGNGTFNVTYAQSGLITVTSSVNAMMGAANPTFTIQGPPASTMADCLTVDVSGANLQVNNTQIKGVTLQNTCSASITIATMKVEWTPAINEELTQLIIAGNTVYNNPAGIPSGTTADIIDTTIAANSTVALTSINFNSNMVGKNLVINFTMTDGSSKAANVQFACGTQAEALYVDSSGAYVGGTNNTYMYGVMLYNACANLATIQINKMTVAFTPTDRKLKLINIGGTTVYTSGGVNSGTQVTLSPAVQITQGQANGKPQYIQTNNDLRGYNYTIAYLMNDSTTKTAAVNLYEQTPNTCLQVINSGCVIGGTGNVEIRGRQWQNTCPLRIIIDRITPRWTSGAKIKEVDVNGVLRWSGGGSGSGTNLNMSPFVEIPGSTTLTVDQYLFNNSMIGQSITSETFRFYPGSTTFAYSATTCP